MEIIEKTGLCLLAVLAGAETFVDIARFGEKKLDLLRRFRPFLHGTPAHDHLGDILSVLDAAQFQRCFVNWVAALTGAPREVIAIDGKTLRRSGAKKDAQAPVHMVSAFAAHQRLVLGQVKVADKSNEIVAIPKLLDLLALEGAVVTIDAIGCQREIARKSKKRPIMCWRSRAIRAPCATMSKCSPPSRRPRTSRMQGSRGTKPSTATTAASKRGPTPRSTMWIGSKSATWPGLQGVVMVESAREIEGRIERETRFFITSLAWLACQLGPVIRSHWAIENSLHWVMDMVFRDDECRIRTDHAPANFTTLKHMAHNIVRKAPGIDLLRLKRKVAAWDDDFLASLLAA